MEILVLLLVLAGYGATLIGWLWIVGVAFSDELFWGLVCLILSPVSFIYAILNFGELKIPLALMVGGIALRVLGGMLALSIA